MKQLAGFSTGTTFGVFPPSLSGRAYHRGWIGLSETDNCGVNSRAIVIHYRFNCLLSIAGRMQCRSVDEVRG